LELWIGATMTYTNPEEFITPGETVTITERNRVYTGTCLGSCGDGKQWWFNLMGTKDPRGNARRVIGIYVPGTDGGWQVLPPDTTLDHPTRHHSTKSSVAR
jgi:hypothetical protein